jgi:hypothetical protein
MLQKNFKFLLGLTLQHCGEEYLMESSRENHRIGLNVPTLYAVDACIPSLRGDL